MIAISNPQQSEAMKMNSITCPVLEPIGDRVIVKRKRASDTTPGGIVLPDAAQESSRIGEVIAVGPGMFRQFPSGTAMPTANAERYPMQTKVGDKVLLPNGAQIIQLDEGDPDSEVVVCQEVQLLAIFR